MDVSSATAVAPVTTQSSSGTSSASKSTLNYNTFLKLLLEQLRNQDPTDPMKSTDYMGQLATFSQVEQTMVGNSKLDAILASSAFSQADSVIGRTVTSADGTISGKVKSVLITSDGPVANLEDGRLIGLGAGIVIS